MITQPLPDALAEFRRKYPMPLCLNGWIVRDHLGNTLAYVHKRSAPFWHDLIDIANAAYELHHPLRLDRDKSNGRSPTDPSP